MIDVLKFYLNLYPNAPEGHYVNRCNLRCVSCGPEDHYVKIKNDTTYQGDWCKLVKIYARKDAETQRSPRNPAGDLKKTPSYLLNFSPNDR